MQARPLQRRLATVVLGVAGLAALRAAVLLVGLELRLGGVQRFHVEAGALLFVALALIARALLPSTNAIAERRSFAIPDSVVAVTGVALAFLVYAPALHLGLLSDDWILVQRVTSGRFGAVSAGLFRPVPLLVWGVLLKSGGGATALHVFNVVVHGANAFLVYRLVADWFGDEVVSVGAGLLFLLTPLAVEPVTWCSGVFDVCALFFCLSTLLIARRAQVSPVASVAACGCAVLAVLCKESAVVLPGLLIVDAAMRRAATPRTVAVIVTVSVLSVAYAGVRLLLAFGASRPPVSRYVFQRALFNTFGALAVSLPGSLWPLWLAIAGVLVIVLTANFLLLNRTVDNTRPLVLAAWCLACVVPVYPIVFVSSDLEGSRYLYESMVGWAALLGLMTRGGSSVVRACGMSALWLLLAIDVAGAHRQLHAWQSAAALRDSVETAARVNDRMQHCQAVAVTDLPDSVSGAYVLRNGGAELLHSVGVTEGVPARGCRFSWSASRQQFLPSD
jgi:hypothetical protein